jgi:hypothetical protein
LGIRVVWANAFFGPEERAAIEEVLADILADGLIEAFTRSHPSDGALAANAWRPTR